jgi:ferric-dicitrate binding protein FerR (iron transport regulator)
LNGVRLAAGATIFAGDIVEVGAASSAALQFGNDLVLVAPSTKLVVESEGVSLRSGQVQIRHNGTDSFTVSGPNFRVNVAASSGAPGTAEIRVGAAVAQVLTVTGIADLTALGSDRPYRLHAGEVATMDAASRDAAGGQGGPVPAAGQITRMIPDVQISRASLQSLAAISAPVFWNDELRSGPTGRAHVVLTDGSLLNLGSNSALRVLQHDAQNQQTSLELAVGRMRGQVLKLSRPGAKFEIRTPAGVAGLVGTDFYLLVTPDSTELMVFEGAVSFTGISGGQAMIVTAGMKLLVSRLGVFQGPSPASPQEMQEAKDSTDVPQTSAQRNKSTPPLVPILISVGAPLAVTGIGLGLSAREPISQYKP